MNCLPCWCSRNAQSGNHLQEHLRAFVVIYSLYCYIMWWITWIYFIS